MSFVAAALVRCDVVVGVVVSVAGFVAAAAFVNVAVVLLLLMLLLLLLLLLLFYCAVCVVRVAACEERGPFLSKK